MSVYVSQSVNSIVSKAMSGCLDKCACPDWEIWNTIRERRNFLSSVIAGAMVCVYMQYT